jgi:hypothetical protein
MERVGATLAVALFPIPPGRVGCREGSPYVVLRINRRTHYEKAFL